MERKRLEGWERELKRREEELGRKEKDDGDAPTPGGLTTRRLRAP